MLLFGRGRRVPVEKALEAPEASSYPRCSWSNSPRREDCTLSALDLADSQLTVGGQASQMLMEGRECFFTRPTRWWPREAF